MNIIAKIEAEIEALERKKAEIQSKCSHPSKTTTNHGDDGNIMTGREPSYWATHVCDLCGHQWDTDQ